jgi:hypothetical protein
VILYEYFDPIPVFRLFFVRRDDSVVRLSPTAKQNSPIPENVTMRFPHKPAFLLCFSLLAAVPGQLLAQGPTRAQFVADVAPAIAAQLCNDEQSPLRRVYTGALKECEASLKKHFGVCSKKVVPETLDPSTNGMEVVVMMSQCLVANYQGGSELQSYNANFTGKLVLHKKQWLESLQPTMMHGMCAQKDSDFGRAYKGNNCQRDVKQLFEKCTTEVDNVVIPATITGLQEAEYHGQIIASCITAHYVGGDVLRSFKAIKAQ